MMRSFYIAKETIPFIRKHKLWEGFFKQRWVVLLLIIVSFIFSFSVFEDLREILSFSAEIQSEISASSLVPDMGDVKEAVESQKKIHNFKWNKISVIDFPRSYNFLFLC